MNQRGDHCLQLLLVCKGYNRYSNWANAKKRIPRAYTPER
jgi:hypothetical protein